MNVDSVSQISVPHQCPDFSKCWFVSFNLWCFQEISYFTFLEFEWKLFPKNNLKQQIRFFNRSNICNYNF